MWFDVLQYGKKIRFMANGLSKEYIYVTPQVDQNRSYT